MKKFSINTLRFDTVAGLTAAVVIPQAMAYASIWNNPLMPILPKGAINDFA